MLLARVSRHRYKTIPRSMNTDRCAPCNVPYEAGLVAFAIRHATECGADVGMVSALQQSVACDTTRQVATLDEASWRLACLDDAGVMTPVPTPRQHWLSLDALHYVLTP